MALSFAVLLLLGLRGEAQREPLVLSGEERLSEQSLAPRIETTSRLLLNTREPSEEFLTEEAKALLLLLKPEESGETDHNRLQGILKKLKTLQERYTVSGRLDEALAVREAIEDYENKAAGIITDTTSLTGYRDQVGRTLKVAILGRTTGTVWGSGFYTDDSDLGTAAVHAGLLKPGQKGVVEVTVWHGQGEYSDDAANGITTLHYNAWEGSYRFGEVLSLQQSRRSQLPEAAQEIVSRLNQSNRKEDALLLNSLEELRRLKEAEYKRGSLDSAVAIRDQIGKLLSERFSAQPSTGNVTRFRERVGETLAFQVVGHLRGTVWGSGIYTDDSDLGAAAVHAGLLRPMQRGMIAVTLLPGQAFYNRSARNGVESLHYGPWTGSYRLEVLATY